VFVTAVCVWSGALQAQLGPGAEPADPEQVARILDQVYLRLPTALGEGPLHEV
jgi:hypothetical protein